MRAVIQRVSEASIVINGEEYASINQGLLVLVGIEDKDRDEDVDWLTGKILRLRIFDDENGVMNRSIVEREGEILVVSQFTLHASTKKGNRPSYIKAARPEYAFGLYTTFVKALQVEKAVKVKTGKFAAHMHVKLTNMGPVTIIIDTKNKE